MLFSSCQSFLQCLHCLAYSVRSGFPQCGHGAEPVGGQGWPLCTTHALHSASSQPVAARSSAVAIIWRSPNRASSRIRASTAGSSWGRSRISALHFGHFGKDICNAPNGADRLCENCPCLFAAQKTALCCIFSSLGMILNPTFESNFEFSHSLADWLDSAVLCKPCSLAKS
jgi:hypothetical protein